MSLNATPILSYLGLPDDYQPSPSTEPTGFLQKHLRELPPHLLILFSSVTTPKERSAIRTVRNRRLKYASSSSSSDLSFDTARSTWPTFWEGRAISGQDENRAEREWADTEFLGGQKQHVGKLAALLGDHAQELEAERVRGLRRAQPVVDDDDFIPEEESDDDEDGPMTGPATAARVEEKPEDAKDAFNRKIREQFIYGLLDVCFNFEFRSTGCG